MRAIAQEQGMGCGVACVASLLGISYKKALKLFREPGNSSTCGFYLKDIREALEKAGKKYISGRVSPKNMAAIRKEGTIVFIRRDRKKYWAGHYLLKTKKGWMNSWINYPDICPAKAGFQKVLPGEAQYVIYEDSK